MQEFWMCLMQYISLRLLYKLLSSYRDETYSEHFQTFKMDFSDYASIQLGNAWICLCMYMPQHPSIYLNMAEDCWMSLNMPA